MILSRLLQLLLPALFPSWRFFKTIGPSPRIETRTPLGSGDWTRLTPPPDYIPPLQMLKRLFWSPGQNAALFRVSLAERVLGDDATRARQLLDSDIARTLAATGPFEYRIVFLSREDGQLTATVCFESGAVAPV